MIHTYCTKVLGHHSICCFSNVVMTILQTKFVNGKAIQTGKVQIWPAVCFSDQMSEWGRNGIQVTDRGSISETANLLGFSRMVRKAKKKKIQSAAVL